MLKIGAVILAGGKSRRMGGIDKAKLTADGISFVERIFSELGSFEERLLSVCDLNRRENYGIPLVADIYPDIGPMGGILSALCECHSDGLFVVPCDMPLFNSGLAEYLLSYLSTDYDAFIAVGRDKRIHPLCGIYGKTAVPVFERQIACGNYRITDALDMMRVKYVFLEHSIFSDDMLLNVNTPPQYQSLQKTISGSAVIAVSGVKNSGKTTLICSVIPILRANGLRVAVIKHDGHDFEPDVPNTDSFRLRKAGAKQIAVYSNERFMMLKEQSDTDIEEIICQFNNCDLIILEGGKYSRYPKIEIARSCISHNPVCDASKLLALCTDLDVSVPGVPVIPLADYKSIALILMDYVVNHRLSKPALTPTPNTLHLY